MRRAILILEDNAERFAAMSDCLCDKFPMFELVLARSAAEAIDWLQIHLHRAIAISLDHDLERRLDQPDAPDPGTGREVADWLACHKPVCPIVIHSTNTHAALGMELSLQDAQWHVERITPYDDLEWVAGAWLPLIRRTIVDCVQPRAQASAPAALDALTMPDSLSLPRAH